MQTKGLHPLGALVLVGIYPDKKVVCHVDGSIFFLHFSITFTPLAFLEFSLLIYVIFLYYLLASEFLTPKLGDLCNVSFYTEDPVVERKATL